MPNAFLTVSIAGFLLAVNALRPFPGTWLAVPSFFAGWLTMELAPHVLVAHVVGVTLIATLGGVHGAQDTAALVLATLTALALVRLIVIANETRAVTERALRSALGEDYAPRADGPAHEDLRTPWRELIRPFRGTHPDVERIKDVPYGEVRRRNLLDVYRPKAGASGAPVLLQVHGGAWAVSNKNHQGRPLMLHMPARGWVCVAPNYRMSPRHVWPAHIVDVKLAIAWIREHAREYGGDPSMIVITGGSAGGHLAALAALTPNDPEYQPGFEDADTTVQACVPYYGVYDWTGMSGSKHTKYQLRMLERIVVKRPYEEDPAAYERASPIFRVRSDAPPFFVIHGAHDSLVPVTETRAFVERLRAISSAPVAYAELPGAQHAFDVFPSIRTAHVIRAVERFAQWCRTAHHPPTASRRAQR